ncbi:hypothetical protein KCV87_30935 [Actinosynnema pretiosum subsp. pretiosum]|uniref:Uncharacterized protein n=2 Tax=Actinosynnema TaxID=40566 RepID=C6WQN1_ACTMD|nr:hypothetical protein [Actinosynnema mirum]ACU38721.1 hypothetical protein Amir_4895 [Actinosynnema mirum DSM 43827]AXX32318.1 hypothetical protein APASM_4953 [Actinosynnema pretiosum subsp. pretiosum]QUF03736.1 hypothetical protein KCV87_30935 [Actinosynnema pretiosum subsp. pretiosum]
MSTKSPDFLPAHGEESAWHRRLTEFAVTTRHYLAWVEFLAAVDSHEGGETQAVLLTVQGLALGIQMSTWLRRQK